jgi:putative CocE/NonD family hydrolase
VGGWGSSYTANTNDWFAERNHPALQAGISRFPDYDPYTDLHFPGGVPNASMGSNWGERVKEMDLNIPRNRGSGPPVGVKPVDEGLDGGLLAAAVEARRDVPSVWETFRVLTYKDEGTPLWGGVSQDWWGINSHADAVERSGSAIYSWASWTDAATAQGILHRFMALSNPQRAVIAAWSHGARQDADPFHPPDHSLDPPEEAQLLEDICFFETYLRGEGEAGKDLVYKTMGEEGWKRTQVWPLPQTEMTSWYFREDGGLSAETPSSGRADRYRVAFTHTTGTRNRWATNNGAGEVAEVIFALHPTSVLSPRGHRIRIAIGGADADTFARIPAEGTPEWTVERSPERASRILLPVIPR